MYKFLLFIGVVCISTIVASAQRLTLPPSGDNHRSIVTQYIGLVSISIDYHSPDVHTPEGTDRTGHIWGELVPWGLTDQVYGTSTSAPWRAGANETTSITISHKVEIGGIPVEAGTYGLFLQPEQSGPWYWILSKDSKTWGSYFYKPENNVAKIPATPEEAPYTEWLTFGFSARNKDRATAFLQWENKRIPFEITVPNYYEYYLANLRQELGSALGFDGESWVAAAEFCVENNINLNEALTWADFAVQGRNLGVRSFRTLSTKASVLMALKRNEEAAKVMDEAISLPGTSVQEIHQYGRQLLAAGQSQKALEIFLKNRKLHPNDTFTTFVGLARGYAAVGDKKNAIKNWELALKNLPADQIQNKKFYESEIAKLKG